MHRHAETVFNLALQIDPPPADNAVLFRIGALADERREFRLLRRIEERFSPWCTAVGKPVEAFLVVAMNPVPQRLAIHPAGLRRRPAIGTLQNKGDRQHPPCGFGIPTLGCSSAKLPRRHIRPGDRHYIQTSII